MTFVLYQDKTPTTKLVFSDFIQQSMCLQYLTNRTKNRGIVLIQTCQQVEHLQSCIMTSRRARDASRQHEETSKSLHRNSDKERTFYLLQIHFTQMLQAQRKDEGEDQYDLSIRQQWNWLSLSIVLQQH